MNLRDARKLKNMTLIEAGVRLETDPGNLSRIERGTQAPGIDLARRMAAFYGMTLDEVFENEGALPKESDRTTADAQDLTDAGNQTPEPMAAGDGPTGKEAA